MTERPDLSRRVAALLAELLTLPFNQRAARLQEAPIAERDAAIAILAELHDQVAWASATRHIETSPGNVASILSPGQRLGPYEILEPIGRGGMGEVYLARRVADFEARVAIKVLRHGIADQARFLHERQILADLEHPNIARLLDAQATPEGLPCLVMEYVPGMRLDQYWQQHELSLTERIDLFLKICRAVSAAHQATILHRDLKPSNILVTVDGVPKLLDFGVATRLDRRSPGAELTQPGAIVGTPQFMSPEQWRQQEPRTTSDVYSLGVMLYQLLAGRLPYTIPSKASPGEIEKLICEQDPPRPSLAAAAIAAPPGAPAGSSPRGPDLSRQLHGDLDNIVLRALHKEPRGRYQSVDELINDVERYRRQEPVHATPPTFGYRLAKWARRRKALAAALVVVAVSLTLTLGIMSYSLEEVIAAQRETEASRSRAREFGRQAEEATLDLASAASERLRHVAGTRAVRRDILTSAVQRLDKLATLKRELAGLSTADIDSLLKLGELELEVGDPKAAHCHFTAALDRCGALERASIPRAQVLFVRSRANLSLADLCRQQGESAQAEALYVAAEAAAREAVALPDADDDIRQHLAAVCEHRGNFLAQREGMEAADKLFGESLHIIADIQKRRSGEERWTEAFQDAQFKEGRLLGLRGDRAAREGRLREAIVLSQRLHDADPANPDRTLQHARNVRALGDCLLDQGNTDKALECVEQARTLRESVLATDPLRTDATLGLVQDLYWSSQVRQQQGEQEQAKRHLDEAIECLGRILALDPRNADFARQMCILESGLAGVVWAVQGAARASTHLEKAAKAAEAVLELETDAASVINLTSAGDIWRYLAATRREAGDAVGATEATAKARDRYRAALERTTGTTQRDLRVALLDLDLEQAVSNGDPAATERITGDLLPLQRTAFAEVPTADNLVKLFGTLKYQARARLVLERLEDALTTFDEIRRLCAKYQTGGATPQNRRLFAEALFEHHQVLGRSGRASDAKEIASEALEWYRALEREGCQVAERVRQLEESLGR